MSNSMIQTIMNTSTAVIANGAIPVGVAVHKYGCKFVVENGAIVVRGTGHYTGTIAVTIQATAATANTVTILVNGASTQMSASFVPAAIGDLWTATIPVAGYIPVGCNCAGCGCTDQNTISLQLTSPAIITNVNAVLDG